MPLDSAVSLMMQALAGAPSLPASLVALAVISVVALWSAGRTVEKREYVLEQ
jgi:hypothetical protein